MKARRFLELFFLLITNLLNAQIATVHDFKCSSSQEFSVTIPAGATSGDIQLPDNLEIVNPSCSACSPELTFGVPVNSAGSASPNRLNYLVTSTTSSTSTITFGVATGTSFSFGSATSVNGILTVNGVQVGNSFVISANPTLNVRIDAVSGGTTYLNNQAVSAHTGSIIVRTYTLTNNTIIDFDGVITFANPTPSGLTRVGNIMYEIGSAGPVTYNSSTGIPVSALHTGESVEITEIIHVTNCLDGGGGNSVASIGVGCDLTHLNTTNTGTSVIPDNANPLLTVNYSPRNLQCFGHATPVTRTVTITNNGAATATNVVFDFITDKRAPFVVTNGSLMVSINGATAVPVQFSNPLLCGDLDDCSGNFSTRDLIFGNLDPRFVVSSTQSVLFARIDNANGAPLTLPTGQSLVISWQEFSVCYQDNIYHVMRDIGGVVRYENSCANPFTLGGIGGGSSDLNSTQILNAYNPVMDGDPDRDRNTSDGVSQIISLTHGADIIIPQDYINAPGAELVYQVLLMDGLDMDLSLGNTAVNPAFPGIAYNTFLTSLNGAAVNIPNIQINSVTPPGTFVHAYEIRIPCTDIINAFNGRPAGGPYFTVEQFIRSFDFNVELRAYCAGPRTPFRINELFRYSCITECVPSLQPSLQMLEHGLASTDGEVMVLCPGCITPGAVINYVPDDVTGIPATHFLRDAVSIGLPDANNNGAPDAASGIAPLADRRLCTDGDVMESVIRVGLPDGQEDAIGGFVLKNLRDRNPRIELDNLYIDVNLGTDDIARIGTATALIQIGAVTHTIILTPADVLTTNFNTEHRYRIHLDPAIGDLSAAEFVELRAQYKIGHIANQENNYTVGYLARYSDCDDCNGFGTTNFSADASGFCVGTNGPACITNTAPAENMFYLCEGGADMFHYIPFNARFTTSVSSPSACENRISIRVNSDVFNDVPNVINRDGFPFEYKSFYGVNPVVNYKVVIPSGYTISGIRVLNDDVTGDAVYVDEVAFVTAINANSYFDPITRELNLPLHYMFKTETETGDDDSDFNPATEFLFLGDEGLHTVLDIALVPDPCSEAQISYYHFEGNTAEVVLASAWPDSPDLTRVSGYQGSPDYLNLPITNLQGSVVGSSPFAITTNQLVVPVRIDNIAPIASAVNPSPLGVSLPSLDAVNSYLNVKIPFSSGLVLTGVASASNPTVALSFTTFTNGGLDNSIVRLGDIPANTINNDANRYLLTFAYTCPSACNPFQTCTSGDSPLPGCFNATEINVDYGWNCARYPDATTDFSKMCSNKTLKFSVTTGAVGLTLTETLNGATAGNGSTIDVDPCQLQQYTIKMNSCKAGTIDMYRVNMQMPASINTLVLSNEAALNSAGITVVRSGTTQSPIFTLTSPDGFNQHGNSIVTLNFTFKTNCNFESATILNSIDAVSYCGFTKTVNGSTNIRSIPVTPTLLDAPVSVNCSSTSISVNFSSAIKNNNNLLRIQLPAGFREVTTLNTGVITKVVSISTTLPVVVQIEPIPGYTGTCNLQTTVTMEQHYTRTCGSESSCEIIAATTSELTCTLNMPTITLSSTPDESNCGCYTLTAQVSPAQVMQINFLTTVLVGTATTNAAGVATLRVCPTANESYTASAFCTTSNSLTLSKPSPNTCSNKQLTPCSKALIDGIDNLIQVHNGNTTALKNNAKVTSYCSPDDNVFGTTKLNEIHPYATGSTYHYMSVPLPLKCNFMMPGNDRDNIKVPAVSDFIAGRPSYLSANDATYATIVGDLPWSPTLYFIDWNKVGTGFRYQGHCPPDDDFMIKDRNSEKAMEIYYVHFYRPKSGFTYADADVDDNTGNTYLNKRDIIQKNDIDKILNVRLDNSLCGPSIPAEYDFMTRNIVVTLLMKNGTTIDAYLGQGGFPPPVVGSSILINNGHPVFQYKEETCPVTCDLKTVIYTTEERCLPNRYTYQLNVGISTVYPGSTTYQWSPAVGLSSPNIKNPLATLTGNEQRVYTVTVTHTSTSGLVCTQTSSITLKRYKNTPITLSATNSGVICKTGSVTLTVSPATSGTTYIWAPSDGLSTTNGSSTIATPSQTKEYTVTTAQGVCRNSAKTQVIVMKDNKELKRQIVCTRINVVTYLKTTILSYPEAIPGALYSWEKLTGGVWVAVGAGSSYHAISGGTYRLRLKKGSCTITSSSAAVIVTTTKTCVATFDVANNTMLASDETDVQDINKIELFPNPSEGDFTLFIHGESSETVNLVVTNLAGEELHHMKDVNKGEQKMFGLDLTSGIYMVKVIDGESIDFIKLVVIR